jgi:Fuc2NAc and GlcNAc transferase
MIHVMVGLIFGWLITRLMLALSQRLRLVAIPNERSFHEQPTPSGGGVGLVLPVVVWAALSFQAGGLAVAVSFAGIAIAVVGFIDDFKHLPSWLRLCVHLGAAALAVWCLQIDVVPIGNIVVGAPLIVAILVTVAVAWFTNLYNFMDGIDGIAGGQCLVLCAGALVIGAPSGLSAELLWLLAGAALGFLLLNWAPARIFMGDVGSGFLGFVIAVITLDLARRGELPHIGTMILLTGFWFDATYTLCVRMFTGQRFASAHRSHFYQKLAERIGHGRTSAVYLVVGAAYLGPLAWLATQYNGLDWLALAVAALPLLIGCFVLKAGVPSVEGVSLSEHT